MVGRRARHERLEQPCRLAKRMARPQVGVQTPKLRGATVWQYPGERRERQVPHAERVEARAHAHARSRDPYGPEQRLERAGALIAQPPQFHADGTDPCANDVLVNLGLHDLLLQLGQQRLGLGEAEANTVGSQIAEVAAEDTDLISRHLAPAGFRFEPDLPFHDATSCRSKAKSVSRPAVAAQVLSTPGRGRRRGRAGPSSTPVRMGNITGRLSRRRARAQAARLSCRSACLTRMFVRSRGAPSRSCVFPGRRRARTSPSPSPR